ncbi:MAG: hypothetical protein HN480_00170, partial [Gammaproteobacteria bacterium]|nr:hypothetical protein [Gammaproteobacteria bacterium]
MFIKKVLFTVFLTFSTILILQLFLSISVKTKSIDRHDNLEITSNINSELLFMGSSRCYSHFDPSFFKENFNLKSTNIGMDGHAELSMTYLRLVDYLKSNTPPKYVILNFDPFTLAGDISNVSPVKYNKDKFSKYAYLPFNDDWETVKHFGYNNLEKYVPLYAIFKYKKLSLYFNNKYTGKSRFERFGYGKNNATWDTINHPTHNQSINYYPLKLDPTGVKKALSGLKDLCSSYEIKLICIQTPVYKSIFVGEIFNLPKK